MEGREAERRERYFSCSNIEEEEELDEKTTKEKKRKIPGNLRIQLLRARTMNETNGSMIQARRTYVKNNETINPITNIADEERKEDEEVEKEGEVEEKKEGKKEEECEEVSNEVEQRKDDNEKPKKTIKERRKIKAKRGYKMKGSNKKNLRNQTVQRKETVDINDNEEVEDDEGEDEEVDAIEAVSSGGIESQEVEGPEPEPKKRKIGRVEGVGSNTRTENMTEFAEFGEVMWEANANRAILDIEQRTEIQSIKDLLNCFDTKEAGKNQTISVIRLTKLKDVYNFGSIRKNL